MKKKATALSPAEWASRISYIITLISLAASLVYVPLRAHLDTGYRESTELHLIIFQTLFGLIIIHLPHFLNRRFGWQIPGALSAAYIIFLFASIFLGEVLTFYYRLPLWDDILHLSSSVLLGIFGFSVAEMLNGAQNRPSPIFTALFATAFAISVGVLWEIYEFSFDGLLGLNMQKFMSNGGEAGNPLVPLSGRGAIMDTMTDLIIDTVGSVSICAVGFVSLKRKGKFINALKVTLRRKSDTEDKKKDEQN